MYYCTESSDMETTVNMESDNLMKQMFQACENAYKVFYRIFLEIYNILIDFSFVLDKFKFHIIVQF